MCFASHFQSECKINNVRSYVLGIYANGLSETTRITTNNRLIAILLRRKWMRAGIGFYKRMHAWRSNTWIWMGYLLLCQADLSIYDRFLRFRHYTLQTLILQFITFHFTWFCVASRSVCLPKRVFNANALHVWAFTGLHTSHVRQLG